MSKELTDLVELNTDNFCYQSWEDGEFVSCSIGYFTISIPIDEFPDLVKFVNETAKLIEKE